MHQYFATGALLTFLAAGSFSVELHAQDYPYDENPNSKPLPRERAPRAAAKKVGTLFRVGIKLGANYATINSNTGDVPFSESGTGGEGLLALGWDLAYQPIFLEVESGYRTLFVGGALKLQQVPLRFGVFYRDRMSESSWWKPGITTSLNLNISQSDNGGQDVALAPAIGVSSIWEIDSFLIELLVNVNRIESGHTFLDFASRIGFRF